MRLRVAVQRHTLPLVNLIFNTTASSTIAAGVRMSTVADFVTAINALVPLESSDGEWGLEEYIVEVIATASTKTTVNSGRAGYECLHYQIVEDVFRENDSIVIRGLTSDEIRERRRGGRLQITGDGRRLVDGVAWGGRFKPLASRPGVVIPPRKRRRLLVSEEEDQDQHDGDQLLQIEYPTQLQGQIGLVLAGGEDNARYGDVEEETSDDEDEDEDYLSDQDEDEGEDEDQGETASDPEPDLDATRQITVSTSFDDADVDMENEAEDGHLYHDELGSLLQEAAEFEKMNAVAPITTPTARKRKRTVEESKHVTFSPQVSNMNVPNLKKTKLGPYLVAHGADEHTDQSNATDDSDHSSETTDDSSAVESPSDSSSANSDNDSDDSTSDSASESDGSASSDIDSTAESTSSSGSDTSSDEAEESHTERKGIVPKTGQSDPRSNGVPRAESLVQEQKAGNPPGSGSVRTKKNNRRVQRRKRLEHLKKEGLLPADAGFAALDLYDGATQVVAADESLNGAEDTNEQRQSRDAERTHDVEDSALSHVNNQDKSKSSIHTPVDKTPVPVESTSEIITATVISPPSAGIPSTRARLDIQSSRRMLFNSLGLRVPKTKADEDNLREKLAVSAQKTQRSIQTRKDAENSSTQQPKHRESWKTKLIISAVECVQEGRVLTAPPFPFKQNWERQQQELTAEEVRLNDLDDSTVLDYDESQNLENDQVAGGEQMQASYHALQTIEMDDLPYPKDFYALKALQTEDIIEGAVIAYKELHMNARYEPEESEYRIARVIAVSGDQISVLLSKGDQREISSSARYDENGQRFYHGFELPSESDEVDDGTRFLSFLNLIQPKLIRGGNVQVAASVAGYDTQPGHSQQDSDLVPESALPQLERVQSATSEGPFDSNLDKQVRNSDSSGGAEMSFIEQDELLQPLDAERKKAGSLQAISNPKSDLRFTARKSTGDPSGMISSGVLSTDSSTGFAKSEETTSSHQDAQKRSLQDYQTNDSSDESKNNGKDKFQMSLQSLMSIESSPELSKAKLDDSAHVASLDSNSRHNLDVFANNDHNANYDTNTAMTSEERDSNFEGFQDPTNESTSPSIQHSSNLSQTEDPAQQNTTLLSETLEEYTDTKADTSKEQQAKDESSPTPKRSSQRINSKVVAPTAKLDQTSPAALMMKSALAGLGSRRSLQRARKKGGKTK